MVEIERIMREGISRGASDIHLVNNMKPMFRINRNLVEMQDAMPLQDDDLMYIFSVFSMYNEEIRYSFERNKRVDLNYEFEGNRFRVNVSLSNKSFVFTLRIIKNSLPEFKDLGLPDVVRRLAMAPQGLILITGKSNSGKTTTLNALVNEINKTENKKILMLEDPIEYTHRSIKSLIVQKEVGEGKDCRSFGEGTVNSLREDCDILVVGEVRDRMTMDAMLEMAESGYLVIGTMHTRSCAETIDRIINFYDLSDQKTVKYMMSSVLKAVVAQRLLKGMNNDLVMAPEIMIVDSIIGGHIRKDKLSSAEIEDAILTSQSKGSLSFIFSLGYLVAQNRISMEVAKSQINEESYEHLENTVYRLKNNMINWQF